MLPRTLLALWQTQRLRKEELSSGCKTDCEDALLILPGRKRIRSEPGVPPLPMPPRAREAAFDSYAS